ncbi:MAG: ribbon-helix-helix protein, CopG family [Micromonosporaceae bacterium]
MSKFDAATAALDDRDWSNATVNKPRSTTIVQSVRMPRDLVEKLFAEAERRGVTPSQLIRDLVEAGLTELADDATITVRVSDLHRAIDSVLHHGDHAT